jgi:hypothetical protein
MRRKGGPHACACSVHFHPLVCSVYALLHPDALALLRLQFARASGAHVNRIGGRKAFINLLLSAV